MATLDVWYSHMEIGEMLEWLRAEVRDRGLAERAGPAARTWPRPGPATACGRSDKLTERVDGELRFVSDPPLIVPLEDLVLGDEARARDRAVAAQADRASTAGHWPTSTIPSRSSATSTWPARWSAWAAWAPGPGSS